MCNALQQLQAHFDFSAETISNPTVNVAPVLVVESTPSNVIYDTKEFTGQQMPRTFHWPFVKLELENAAGPLNDETCRTEKNHIECAFDQLFGTPLSGGPLFDFCQSDLVSMVNNLHLEKQKQNQKYEWKVGAQLSAKQHESVCSFLDQHSTSFAFSAKELGHYTGGEVQIKISTEDPIFTPPHRLSYAEWEIVRQKCAELLDLNLIRESKQTKYVSATVLPRKRDEHGNYTDYRMCGDYRPMNLLTPPDCYRMPLPESIFDRLAGSTIFSTIDLRQGYNQIPLVEADKAKTAFWGIDKKVYEWNYIPFGIKNAPALFQRIMDKVICGLNFAAVYLDDIIIWSADLDTHLKHIDAVLKALDNANLKAHPGKCHFATDRLAYLGHLVTPEGVSPQQKKIEAIIHMPAPTDVPSLRSVLGLFNYYRKFVNRYSEVARPLHDLLLKDTKWHWDTPQEEAYAQLKQALSTAPCLRHPVLDRKFILHTDFSQRGIGAILAQNDPITGDEYVVQYASRSLNKAESNYSSYEGECLAAVWGILHFRTYLYGTEFDIFTDHQPLRWLMENNNLKGKHARWAMKIQEFWPFNIHYRSGRQNANADALSRNPLPDTTDFCDARLDDTLQHIIVNAVEASNDPEEFQLDIWKDQEVLKFLTLKQHSHQDPKVSRSHYSTSKSLRKRFQLYFQEV